jgi:hypothetical protein
MGIRKSTNASKTWSPEVDSSGNVKMPGMVRTTVRGQSLLSNGVLFKAGPNSQFTQNPTETDILTIPIGSELLDGGYSYHSSLGKQPPIIRGGFMLSAGEEKAMELLFNSTLGINFLSSTLSNSSIFQKATVVFTLTESDNPASEVVIASCDAMASQCTNYPTSTNFILDYDFTLAPSSISSGSSWNSRVHLRGVLGNGFGGVIPQAEETAPYPVINWAKDQILRVKQKWDLGFPAGYIYVDTLTIKWV